MSEEAASTTTTTTTTTTTLSPTNNTPSLSENNHDTTTTDHQNKNNFVVEVEDEEIDEVEGIRFVDYVDESQLDSVMSLVGRDLSEPYSIFTYRYFLHRFPHLCILAVPIIDTDDDTTNNTTSSTACEPIGCVVGKMDYEDSEFDNNESFPLLSKANNNTINNINQSYTNSTNNNSTTGGSSSSIVQTSPYNVSVGYIGMLAVSKEYRRRGIGKALVQRILLRMKQYYPTCTSVTLETEVSNVSAQRLYQDSFGFLREELLVRYYLNWNDAYRLRLWF